MNARTLPAVVALCLATTACDEPLDNANDAESGEVGYHETIRPLLERHCNGCHAAGGIAPFALDTWETVQPLAPAIVDAVVDRRMPPWPADPNCRDLDGQTVLDAEEIGAFEAWLAAGSPEGDPSRYVAPELPEPTPVRPPDRVLDPNVSYIPDASVPDDYRCIPLEQSFDDDTFVTAFDVYPGDERVVHHVILYLIRPDLVGEMQALDERDDGPGYSCFGGTGVGIDELLAGWVPGAERLTFPDDTAFLIPAGSRIVMQVHYNVLGLGGEPPPQDHTSAALWTLPAGQTPERLISMPLFANFGIDIPAGVSAHDEVLRLGIPFNGRIHGQLPHMHTLGTSIYVDHVPFDDEDGASCLVDIPRWDFQWQRIYQHASDDFVEVRAGDWLELGCRFDNSSANQPIVNGEQIEPRDVRFGDGTLDEMCLSFVMTSVPYYEGSGVCGGFDECLSTCADGDAACASTCLYGAGAECGPCFFSAVEGCAVEHCIEPAFAFDQCRRSCSDPLGCHTNACGAEFDALWSCLQEPIESGACNAGTVQCGIVF